MEENPNIIWAQIFVDGLAQAGQQVGEFEEGMHGVEHSCAVPGE